MIIAYSDYYCQGGIVSYRLNYRYTDQRARLGGPGRHVSVGGAVRHTRRHRGAGVLCLPQARATSGGPRLTMNGVR